MRKTKGFTLLELVIVIIVLGILGAIAIPKYMGIRETAVTTAKTTATDSVRSVYAIAMLDLKQYPSVKQLGDYVHAEAGLEGAKVAAKGIEVVIDKRTYLVPTYIDTACSKQTETNTDIVQCIGFINNTASPSPDQVILPANHDNADNTLLQNIITACAEIANEKTKSTYKDFDPKQYLNNKDYKVNNPTTRVWYNNFLNAFKDHGKLQLESLYAEGNITLEEYAQIASGVRHHARIFTRDHMIDSKMREGNEKRDAKKYGSLQGATFEWLFKKQLKEQKAAFEEKNTGKTFNERPTKDGGNFDLDKAYRRIIEKSTETNWSVNKFVGICYGWFSVVDNLVCNPIATYFMPET